MKDVRRELKDVQSGLQRLTLFVQRVSFETELITENNQHEREKLALQWKHELSLVERRLPTSKNND